MDPLYYLYGITASQSEEFPLATDGLAAVYEKVSANEFGQDAIHTHLKNMDWVNEKVIKHQRKLQEVGEKTAVVPLKFGSVFKSERSILDLLATRGKEFKSLLAKFNGKQEWGLKLFYDASRLNEWIELNAATLKGLDRQISGATSGEAFLLKKRKGDQLKKLTKELLNEQRKRVFEFVSELSDDVQLNKETDPSLSGQQGHNFLNVALLVSKEQADELAVYQNQTLSTLTQMGVSLNVSGPWPPYSFVNNG